MAYWKEEAWKKKSGLQRDSNPWPPRCGALLYQLSYEATHSLQELQELFWVAWFRQGFFGYVQNNLKIHGSVCLSQPGSSADKYNQTFCVISFHIFWRFLRLWNSTWNFLGVNFSSREFFGLLEDLGIFSLLHRINCLFYKKSCQIGSLI